MSAALASCLQLLQALGPRWPACKQRSCASDELSPWLVEGHRGPNGCGGLALELMQQGVDRHGCRALATQMTAAGPSGVKRLGHVNAPGRVRLLLLGCCILAFAWRLSICRT